MTLVSRVESVTKYLVDVLLTLILLVNIDAE